MTTSTEAVTPKTLRTTVADPGFPVGGGGGGGANLRRRRFSVKMYAKMKELGPVGGRAPGTPLDPPMINFGMYLKRTDPCLSRSLQEWMRRYDQISGVFGQPSRCAHSVTELHRHLQLKEKHQWVGIPDSNCKLNSQAARMYLFENLNLERYHCY